MPKRIDAELRARAVRLVREHQQEYPRRRGDGRGVQAVGRLLRVGAPVGRPGGGRRWRPARGGGEEHEEIKKLKVENRRLREDVAILKAATSFFVGELDPRNR